MSSLFGDVFLVGADGYWFLDMLEGSLTRPWVNREALVAELDTVAGHDRYLLGGLAIAAHARGLELAEGQVYDFAPAPILGGKIAVDNVMMMDFVVKLDIASQVHQQIRR